MYCECSGFDRGLEKQLVQLHCQETMETSFAALQPARACVLSLAGSYTAESLDLAGLQSLACFELAGLHHKQ